jgi:hypothetical protein
LKTGKTGQRSASKNTKAVPGGLPTMNRIWLSINVPWLLNLSAENPLERKEESI